MRSARPGWRAAAVGLVLALLWASFGPARPATAGGDLSAGREKSGKCAVCHGKDGIAKRPDVPNLAGQSAIYMREQLLRYRSGARVHPEMNVIAGPLSDADVEDLVAYFSAIEITARPPD